MQGKYDAEAAKGLMTEGKQLAPNANMDPARHLPGVAGRRPRTTRTVAGRRDTEPFVRECHLGKYWFLGNCRYKKTTYEGHSTSVSDRKSFPLQTQNSGGGGGEVFGRDSEGTDQTGEKNIRKRCKRAVRARRHSQTFFSIISATLYTPATTVRLFSPSSLQRCTRP